MISNQSEESVVYSATESSLLDVLAGDRTVVVKLRPEVLKATGNTIRVTVPGLLQSDKPCTISKIYVGPLITAAGHAWQFSSATQLLWEGGESVDLDNIAKTSDSTPFSFDGSIGLAIAMEFTTGSYIPIATNIEDDGVLSFYKDGVTEAASTSKSAGYTALPKTMLGIVAVLSSL